MKPGSVIVDLAVRQGGNCPLSVKDETIVRHNVKIVAPSNLPASLAADREAIKASFGIVDPEMETVTYAELQQRRELAVAAAIPAPARP